MTINHLPDEVLLDIFDHYQQGIDPYDLPLGEEYAWFDIAHVCRKWRAIMFASSTRLDLGITVGPEKPGNIEMILSDAWPILIKYRQRHRNFSGSALWRLHAALRHHDRVRKISFRGTSADFDELFKGTNRPFPALESLSLFFNDDLKLPDTFLGGPDLSYLHLRCLKLYSASLASISGFLSSARSLTYLLLRIDIASSSSPATSFLACLQGMPCLRSLDLSVLNPLDPSSRPPTPKDIVTLSKLTRFRYGGRHLFLNALVAGLSAPSLLVVDMGLIDGIWFPIEHLPRFIDGIEEHYYAFSVIFGVQNFRLSLQGKSEYIPRFTLGSRSTSSRSPEAIIQMSDTLSTRLTTVEELHISFDETAIADSIPWRRFYQQFPSVKVLRTKGINNHWIAHTLLQDHEEPDDDPTFLPSLEEIELPWLAEVAAFQPFVSARRQAGRPVKVFFAPDG